MLHGKKSACCMCHACFVIWNSLDVDAKFFLVVFGSVVATIVPVHVAVCGSLAYARIEN